VQGTDLRITCTFSEDPGQERGQGGPFAQGHSCAQPSNNPCKQEWPQTCGLRSTVPTCGLPSWSCLAGFTEAQMWARCTAFATESAEDRYGTMTSTSAFARP